VATIISSAPGFAQPHFAECPRHWSLATVDERTFYYPILYDATQRNHLRWENVPGPGPEGYQHATLTPAGEQLYVGWYEKGDSYFLPVARPVFDRVDGIWRRRDGRYRVTYYWRYHPRVRDGYGFIDMLVQMSSAFIVKREGKWCLEDPDIFNPGVPHMVSVKRSRPRYR
jgi:hypothetical protein